MGQEQTCSSPECKLEYSYKLLYQQLMIAASKDLRRFKKATFAGKIVKIDVLQHAPEPKFIRLCNAVMDDDIIIVGAGLGLEGIDRFIYGDDDEKGSSKSGKTAETITTG